MPGRGRREGTGMTSDVMAGGRFVYRRFYAGPVRAVVFDWAGTTVDYGSRAPVEAFVEAFRRRGVELSVREARGPMGAAKRDHIRELLSSEDVRERWREANGCLPSGEDVGAVYEEFLPLQIESAAEHAKLVPGTAEVVEALRARGIRIGSSSGYGHEIMAKVLSSAREQGYEPDALVCPEDVPAGRPYPWMMFKNAMDLGVYPMSACVKAGDTITDVEEGLNAGAWTVGFARSGNELGLSEKETEALNQRELAARSDGVYERMYRAGAHYVVDTIADLPAVLDSIEARLGRGEQP